jgi:hypothetical protein
VQEKDGHSGRQLLTYDAAMASFKKIAFTTCLEVLLIGIAAAYQLKQEAPPLREHHIDFPSTSISASDLRSFLADDFTIVTDVRDLPRPVLAAYTEIGGTRPLMANPGQNFNATDFIDDASVPRKRLIFAGISRNKYFVHYEQGGFAHSYVLALFNFGPKEFKPLWLGFCGASKTLVDLRSNVNNGRCH